MRREEESEWLLLGWGWFSVLVWAWMLASRQQAAGSTAAASQSWGTGTALRQEEKAEEGAGWESESLPGHPCLAKEMPVH